MAEVSGSSPLPPTTCGARRLMYAAVTSRRKVQTRVECPANRQRSPRRLQNRARRSAKPSDHLNASRKIDEKIADLGDWRGERLSEIRRIIREVAPGVIEEWKWMGSPAWSHGGIFAVANAHKDKVKLTFAHGAELPDPMKLFNATLGGNTWRAIDLREGDRIDDAALRALVREAVTHNTTQPVKPILLSGGNPQIAKADGDAPVQSYIAAMPGWKSDVGRRLDELIMRTVPDVRKAVRWNSPWYGIEGEGWFMSYHVFARYIKVAFLNGASLQPVPPGAGKDNDSRWVDVYEGELDVDPAGDRSARLAWVRQTVKFDSSLFTKPREGLLRSLPLTQPTAEPDVV